LRVQRVELLVEPWLGRGPSYRIAQPLPPPPPPPPPPPDWLTDGALMAELKSPIGSLSRRPKKRGPCPRCACDGEGTCETASKSGITGKAVGHHHQPAAYCRYHSAHTSTGPGASSVRWAVKDLAETADVYRPSFFATCSRTSTGFGLDDRDRKAISLRFDRR